MIITVICPRLQASFRLLSFLFAHFEKAGPDPAPWVEGWGLMGREMNIHILLNMI